MKTATRPAPSLADVLMPKRCDSCGQPVPPSPAELAEALSASLTAGLTRLLGGMPAGGARTAGTTARTSLASQGRRGDECRRCEHDDCHCTCCIGDADLVVWARLGERRVVPLTVENPRRRERRVRLELSGWTTKGGRPAPVQAQIAPPHEFTLGPCEERAVTILVNTAPVGGEPGEAVGTAAAGEAEAGRQQRELPDVDDCVVAYADLRLEGCDVRPVRIAVALLPRDCESFRVECDCGCC